MNQTIIPCGNHTLTLLQPDAPARGLIVLPMSARHAACTALLPPDFADALLFIDGVSWNDDLSPWPAPAVFAAEDDFAGHADALLHRLTAFILPAAQSRLPLPPLYRALAGYSLAGLFSVYAAFRTDAFTRVASVSGSLWYDDFLPFAHRTPFAARVDRAYFSVGAKEKRVRNPRMARVEENTRAAEALFRSRSAETRFTLHPGNHFADPDGRMAAALRFLAGNEK